MYTEEAYWKILIDGRLEIFNNRAERNIKHFVIGRKKWYLPPTHQTMLRLAIYYYSLIESANENDLNPFEYLTWIFTNVFNLGKPGYVSDIKALLPNREILQK